MERVLYCGIEEIYVLSCGNVYKLGNQTKSEVPKPIPNLINIVSIACGNLHLLCLNDEGIVFGFGRSYDGQLGNEFIPHQHSPKIIKGLPDRIKQVHACRFHSIVIDSEDYMWSFGASDDGILGRPIDGITLFGHNPGRISLPRIQYLSCGGFHNVCVDFDGKVYAWGKNEGQLGNIKSLEAIVLEPTLVDIPTRSGDIIDIISGYFHTMILYSNGDLICLSSNSCPKELQNISKIACSNCYCIVITNEGNLIVWTTDSTEQQATEIQQQYQLIYEERGILLASMGGHEFIIKCGDDSVMGMGKNRNKQLGFNGASWQFKNLPENWWSVFPNLASRKKSARKILH